MRSNKPYRILKIHFKGGLVSLDPNIPIREWNRLLPQAETTLNLLRRSRLNPKLSAHAFLFGQFDYNKTPIIPPGTKILVHKKTENRGSWAPTGDNSCTIGQLPEHRCVGYVITKTRGERDTDTLQFPPMKLLFQH